MFYEPEINALKQYACFKRLYFRKQRKQAKRFEQGQRINYIQRIYYFACAWNKNNSSAKRSYCCFSTLCKIIHVYTSCLENESVLWFVYNQRTNKKMIHYN